MAIKVDGIQSEDELKKAQAAAQAQGSTITNYSEWSEILGEFQENGIQSTGSYSGDKALREEIKAAVAEYASQVQEQEKFNRIYLITKKLKRFKKQPKQTEIKR